MSGFFIKRWEVGYNLLKQKLLKSWKMIDNFGRIESEVKHDPCPQNNRSEITFLNVSTQTFQSLT